MDPVAPEHRHGGDDHGGVDTVDIGGFSFQLQNVDGATRMEAPTPTRGASEKKKPWFENAGGRRGRG